MLSWALTMGHQLTKTLEWLIVSWVVYHSPYKSQQAQQQSILRWKWYIWDWHEQGQRAQVSCTNRRHVPVPQTSKAQPPMASMTLPQFTPSISL